jgi:hypothetical protein
VRSIAKARLPNIPFECQSEYLVYLGWLSTVDCWFLRLISRYGTNGTTCSIMEPSKSMVDKMFHDGTKWYQKTRSWPSKTRNNGTMVPQFISLVVGNNGLKQLAVGGGWWRKREWTRRAAKWPFSYTIQYCTPYTLSSYSRYFDSKCISCTRGSQ